MGLRRHRIEHARRSGASYGAILSLLALASVAQADERLVELLESGKLERAANPVPVNYLLNEGRGKLDAELEACRPGSAHDRAAGADKPHVAVMRACRAA